MTAVLSHEAGGRSPLSRPGARRALARQLSRIEAGDAVAAAESGEVTGPSDRVIGVTGPPGVGKSTLVNHMVATIRQSGKTVAVLAVDPSSPLTGGALLGDRIRMADHLGDAGVYIRSLASRGQLGGIAAAVPSAAGALLAHCFDLVIIETVGVGQVDVDIVGIAGTVVLVVGPDSGDDVQASKGGLLETADIVVVNKADHFGADRTARDIRDALQLSPRQGREQTVVLTDGRTGAGTAELVIAIERCHDRLRAGSPLTVLATHETLRDVVRALALGEVEGAWAHPHARATIEQWRAGALDTAAAALEILSLRAANRASVTGEFLTRART